MKRAVMMSVLLLSVAGAVRAEDRTKPNADSATYYMNVGKTEQAARKYPNAWRSFEKAAKFDPTNIDAQLKIAEVCQQMNRMAPAIKALEDATHIDPNNAKVSWKLGKLYFLYGQWDKVIALLPQAHKQMPDAPGYDFMMGKSYYSQQNYGKGIAHLQKAIKEDDQNAEAYYLIGHMYSLMDNYKPGIPYYEKALTIGTGEGAGVRIYEYAMVLATAGDYENSIKWFKKALDGGYPARDDFYMNFAYTLADGNKSDKAIVMMEDMLVRRPQDLSLLNGIADVCYHAGKYKKAIEYWDKILAMDESNARPLYHIGLAYIKMGNTKDGQALCDKAISMDPALAVLKHEKKM